MAKLQHQFQCQLRDMELRVHAQHSGHSSNGPLALMQQQVRTLKDENEQLKVRPCTSVVDT